MAYNNWYITGDVHGVFTRFKHLHEKNIAVIILGDCAVNWTFDYHDYEFKKSISNDYSNITFYLVRGNHDGRPQKVLNMKTVYDDNVGNYVYMEYEFPNIRYFIDGGIYIIENHKILTIGGAYSVDKEYRLMKGAIWHPDEQLTIQEMEEIESKVFGENFDLVLTHTCPLNFIPVDLFLSGIDQSKVDKTMEYWLEKIKNKFNWKYWIFGHYHTDRYQAQNVEIMYWEIKPLSRIWNRIDSYGDINVK